MAWAYSHWIKGRVSEASLAHSSICRAQDQHQMVSTCAADEQGDLQSLAEECLTMGMRAYMGHRMSVAAVLEPPPS